MLSCGFAIANMTPFRGVSVDAGTAFEVGFMAASGATVFGYTNEPSAYHLRVAGHAPLNPAIAAHAGGGWNVENFGLVDNLMLPFGIAESGGVLIEHAVADPHRLFHDLTAFGTLRGADRRRRVGRAAGRLTRSPVAPLPWAPATAFASLDRRRRRPIFGLAGPGPDLFVRSVPVS